MQIFSYFLFFVVIWWVLFFIFLPIKNENPKEWQVGNASSTPIKKLSFNKSNNCISFIFYYFDYFNILWFRFSFYI